jgi:hypothetical protein
MGENETVGAQVLVDIVLFMSFRLCRYLGFSSFYIYVWKVVLYSPYIYALLSWDLTRDRKRAFQHVNNRNKKASVPIQP